MLENHNWAQIESGDLAPYLDGTLLPQASLAPNYHDAGLHPSLPNYIWLEAGSNLGIRDDRNPSAHHLATTDHLVSQLDAAGVSWKAYEEGIDGTRCPLTGRGAYVPKHLAMIYFDDVTGGNDPSSKHCIDHVRPLSELSGDLEHDRVARYDFITPDECHDMHSVCPPERGTIQPGDAWLKEWVPKILASHAYEDDGLLLITWDESTPTRACPLANCPVGLIALSPLAKGGGYRSDLPYDHSSTLRTLEEIFHVPLLRGARTATDLRDLFETFP